MKNGGVWSNLVRPTINNKKTGEYFQAKCNHPKANLVEIVESYPGPNTSEVPQFIPREILKMLKSCRLRSSCGKDGVFSKDLLDNWEVIQHKVTAICNVLVINQRVPRDWAHALIQRIPKKRYDPEDLTSLRGISLLPCLYKVFIKGIVERVKSRII